MNLTGTVICFAIILTSLPDRVKPENLSLYISDGNFISDAKIRRNKSLYLLMIYLYPRRE